MSDEHRCQWGKGRDVGPKRCPYHAVLGGFCLKHTPQARERVLKAKVERTFAAWKRAVEELEQLQETLK